MAIAGSGLTIVEMADTHTADVLALINADRVPGQPECTPGMLAEARAGRSPVDSAWWADLEQPRVRVATDSTNGVLGVISYAVRPHDRTGIIPWLHAAEDPILIGFLLDNALAELSRQPMVEAFDFATALGLGLEALPVRHRAATHNALLARGFNSSDMWRYMHRELPADDLPRTWAYQFRAAEEPTSRTLEIVENGSTIAEATVGEPVAGIGVLWWIGVNPEARGRELGLRLLGSALDVLVGLGAAEVILYVDDDAPADDKERDRRAASAMYDRAGFTEVDRLHSYRLTR